MILKKNIKTILIVDFGSQFTQLIARRIREIGVYSEIINYKYLNRLKFNKIEGIIFSGGPLNVNNKLIKIKKKIYKFNIPILGICFGHQIISKSLGGKVKQSKIREFGNSIIKEKLKSKLTKNFLQIQKTQSLLL